MRMQLDHRSPRYPAGRRRTVRIWTICLAAAIAVDLSAATAGNTVPLTAKWIWRDQADANPYNQMIVARKRVSLERVRAATMAITADTWYRLLINGQWVNDGPCRAWPEHFQYDVLDVTSYLQPGVNEIQVIARYFGVGDFHHVPQRTGLLAQLDVTHLDGQRRSIPTDSTWEIAASAVLVANVPKACIQKAPA